MRVMMSAVILTYSFQIGTNNIVIMMKVSILYTFSHWYTFMSLIMCLLSGWYIMIGTPKTMAIFNHTHHLWVCCNAMHLDHTCKYVKCHNCFKRPKKRPQRKNTKTGRCDHKLLQPFDNESYYKSPYYESMEDEDNFPKICVTCDGTIYCMTSTSVWVPVCVMPGLLCDN